MAKQDPYLRRARLVRVVDGDTVLLEIDLGYKVKTEQMIRLLNVDAPEIFHTSIEERERGLLCMKQVIEWFERRTPATWPLTIQSTGQDKYGRWVATINADELSLNDYVNSYLAKINPA